MPTGCSEQSNVYIHKQKMVPITVRARSFLLVLELSKNKIERRG